MPLSWFHGVPGLKIVCPSTPNDAAALLKAAIRDENPVLFLEHKRLYSTKGPRLDTELEIGRASVARTGSDVTLVSVMRGVHDCLQAADELSARGIEAEVIDLRSIRPMDIDTIERSVGRTNRLCVVEEGPRTGGWAAEVLARITELALDDLDDAWRIATLDHPVPYSPPLEDAFLPGPARIVDEIAARLEP